MAFPPATTSARTNLTRRWKIVRNLLAYKTKLRGTGFATCKRWRCELRATAEIHKRNDSEGGFMFWTILIIALTLGLIVVGQLGGLLIHLLLAVATLILVIQFFSEDGTAA